MTPPSQAEKKITLEELRKDMVDYLEMGMPSNHKQAEYYNKMIVVAQNKMERVMKRFCPLCKKLFKNQKLRKEHLLLVHKIL